MLFAKVIGNVVATRKTGGSEGFHLIVVRFLDHALAQTCKTAVAVDTVGSRPDDMVLLCGSSSARMTSKTRNACVDLAIVGIVDVVSKDKTDVYKK
jgi:ethanolamine utilization protein EutN